MKKAFPFVVVFILVALTVFAQAGLSTDYKQECRKVIYAVKPVEAIGKLDDDTLKRLGRYSLGIPVSGQEKLNETDTELFSFLATVELTRRDLSNDDFSIYLQEWHEKLASWIKGKGDVSIYIKEDGWLDLFRLNLIFAD